MAILGATDRVDADRADALFSALARSAVRVTLAALRASACDPHLARVSAEIEPRVANAIAVHERQAPHRRNARAQRHDLPRCCDRRHTRIRRARARQLRAANDLAVGFAIEEVARRGAW